MRNWTAFTYFLFFTVISFTLAPVSKSVMVKYKPHSYTFRLLVYWDLKLSALVFVRFFLKSHFTLLRGGLSPFLPLLFLPSLTGICVVVDLMSILEGITFEISRSFFCYLASQAVSINGYSAYWCCFVSGREFYGILAFKTHITQDLGMRKCFIYFSLSFSYSILILFSTLLYILFIFCRAPR